jgi:hypothetical protein
VANAMAAYKKRLMSFRSFLVVPGHALWTWGPEPPLNRAV